MAKKSDDKLAKALKKGKKAANTADDDAVPDLFASSRALDAKPAAAKNPGATANDNRKAATAAVAQELNKRDAKRAAKSSAKRQPRGEDDAIPDLFSSGKATVAADTASSVSSIGSERVPPIDAPTLTDDVAKESTVPLTRHPALGPKDPLEGTVVGATPDPDSKRLQKTMERSGAFRSSEAPETPRQAQQRLKAKEKKEKRFRARYEELMDAVERSADELGYHPDRPVTEIPDVPPGYREVEMIPVVPDRAYVRMLFHELTNTYLYQAVEPRLTENEEEILFFLRDTLIRTLDGRRALDDVTGQEVLLDAVRQAIVDHRILIDEVGARRIEYYLIRDFLGYGPIDVLMRDPMIEDISCDGPTIPIYLFHRQYESIKTTIVFPEDLQLDSFVIRLAQRSGKHISIADPILDATLPDGSRLQSTLSREVTTRGSSFTIRKFKGDPLTPPDLIRYGTVSPRMMAYFWFVMEAGHSFILAGGTASGKTTSLNAICQFIPPEKKVVSIEDTREINLNHENWIAGVTRSGFGGEYIGGKPAGTIDMYKLLEAALRQRPEYLLVGEVRGPEALTLFQAMATGHAVYSTMHADSATSAVYRLENPPINVPRMMLQTLDIVLIQGQARLGDKMVRRLREVMEIVGFDPETKELLTNTVFEWHVAGDEHRYLGKSFSLERIMEAKNMSEEAVMAEWERRIEVLEWMEREGLRHYTEVASAIASYYRDPERFLQTIRTGAPPPKLEAPIPEPAKAVVKEAANGTS